MPKMIWSKEKVAQLKQQEVESLRSNALRLHETEVVAWCDEILQRKPSKNGRPGKVKRQHELDGRPLLRMNAAMEARGVKLRNPRWSWGGVRSSDGIVVLTMWAAGVQKDGQLSRYLLWGPEKGWSASPGGKERLEHCRLAIANGGRAEGVLIYGARRGRDVPEDEPSKVSGVDAHKVISLRIQQEGQEYWAAWGPE
jgi:hypothetical protein